MQAITNNLELGDVYTVTALLLLHLFIELYVVHISFIFIVPSKDFALWRDRN